MDFQAEFLKHQEAIFLSLSDANLSKAISICRELIKLNDDLKSKYNYKLISIEWRLENYSQNSYKKPTNNEFHLDDISILFTDFQELINSISLDATKIEPFIESIDITLAPRKKTYPLKVFISYSKKDEEWKNDLDDHFSALKQEGKIEIWHDRMISPGDSWNSKIIDALIHSDLVLFLLSSSFMASNYIWEKELPKAIDRHNRGESKIIPIFTKPVDIEGTILNELQGLPRDKNWLSTYPDRDSGLFNLSLELRKIINDWKF